MVPRILRYPDTLGILNRPGTFSRPISLWLRRKEKQQGQVYTFDRLSFFSSLFICLAFKDLFSLIACGGDVVKGTGIDYS